MKIMCQLHADFFEVHWPLRLPGRGRPSTFPSRRPLAKDQRRRPGPRAALEQGRGCCGVPVQVGQQPPQFPLQEAPGGPAGHRQAVCTRGCQWVCKSVWPVCVWVLLCVRAPLCTQDSGCPPATRPAASVTHPLFRHPRSPRGSPCDSAPVGAGGPGGQKLVTGEAEGSGMRLLPPGPPTPSCQLPWWPGGHSVYPC